MKTKREEEVNERIMKPYQQIYNVVTLYIDNNKSQQKHRSRMKGESEENFVMYENCTSAKYNISSLKELFQKGPLHSFQQDVDSGYFQTCHQKIFLHQQNISLGLSFRPPKLKHF